MVNPDDEFEGVVQTSTSQDLESAVSANQPPSLSPQPVPERPSAEPLGCVPVEGELGCIQVATILAIAEGSSDPTAGVAGGGSVVPPPLDLGALSGAAAGGPDSEKLPQLSAGKFAANRDRLSVERGTHPGYRHLSCPWLPGPLALALAKQGGLGLTSLAGAAGDRSEFFGEGARQHFFDLFHQQSSYVAKEGPDAKGRLLESARGSLLAKVQHALMCQLGSVCRSLLPAAFCLAVAQC